MKTLVTLTCALLFSSAAAAQVRIDVTLGGKTLDVRDDANRAVASYQISPGTAGHPTPQGAFTVRKIVWNPAWVPPKAGWAKGKKATAPQDPKNPMKVVKIFFKEPDLYMHGTADDKLLGDPASHGCIRMAPADAYALARILMENGGAQKDETWYQSVINGKRSVTVVLPKPVAMRVGA
jgi:lipoprotein-anchoring transpeptidase ErfK/SrfK